MKKAITGLFSGARWELCESVNDEKSFDESVFVAKLRGPVAVCDGTSLNQRFYSQKLWETAIRNKERELQEEGLFGTLGHDVEMDEAAISQGQITHKMTSMWINEKSKMVEAEILILNSAAGRELNTALRSGMKISTSSRAYGELKGKTSSGADIIDESTFRLIGFDFVLNPGVRAATPVLVESETIIREEHKMEKELLESYAERSKLMTELKEAEKSQGKAERELSEAVSLKEKLEVELKESKESSAKLHKFLAKAFGKNPVATIKAMNEGIAKWMLIPEMAEYAKELGIFDTNGVTYEQTYKKLIESVQGSAKVGSPKKLNEELETLKKYRETCGTTPEKVRKALEILESYGKLGTLAEVNESLKRAKQITNKFHQAKRSLNASKICAGLGLYESVPEGASKEVVEKISKVNEARKENVIKLLRKMPAKEVIATLRATGSAKKRKAVNESAPVQGAAQQGTKVPLKVVAGGAAKKPATAAEAGGAAGKLFESMNFVEIKTPEIAH